MSVINATEKAAISGEWGAEMVPYVLKPQSEAWKDREITVLLPKGTQYSRGVITTVQNGTTARRPDYVEDNSIPIPASGKVAIKMGFEKSEKSVNRVGTERVTSFFILSLSQLKGSKEQYIDQIKKSQVQVLSEKENSLVTVKKVINAGQRSILEREIEVLEKTLIVDDVVLQIQITGNLVVPLSRYYGSTEALAKVLDKIQVAPKVPAAKL